MDDETQFDLNEKVNFTRRPDPNSGLDDMMSMKTHVKKDSESTWMKLKKTMGKLKKGKVAGAKFKMPVGTL